MFCFLSCLSLLLLLAWLLLCKRISYFDETVNSLWLSDDTSPFHASRLTTSVSYRNLT